MGPYNTYTIHTAVCAHAISRSCQRLGGRRGVPSSKLCMGSVSPLQTIISSQARVCAVTPQAAHMVRKHIVPISTQPGAQFIGQAAYGARAHGRRVPAGRAAELPRPFGSRKPEGGAPTRPYPCPKLYDCADGIETPSCCGARRGLSLSEGAEAVARRPEAEAAALLLAEVACRLASERRKARSLSLIGLPSSSERLGKREDEGDRMRVTGWGRR